MENPDELVPVVVFMVLIAVSWLLIFGHRGLAQRLEKDPDKRPQISVNLAAFWSIIVLSVALPVMALAVPGEVYELPGGGLASVVFFGLGVVWFLVLRKWDWYLRYAANMMFAMSMGSREHGESVEMYDESARRALPRAAAIASLAFVIALVRALLQR
jgi:hypothetical protein